MQLDLGGDGRVKGVTMLLLLQEWSNIYKIDSWLDVVGKGMREFRGYPQFQA